jgi:hypothetical protein
VEWHAARPVAIVHVVLGPADSAMPLEPNRHKPNSEKLCILERTIASGNEKVMFARIESREKYLGAE